MIGNPPYQEETTGDNKEYAPPVYHLFLESAYNVADKVEMIHPARFLFNAGATPKQWNEKMLNDSHFKVLWLEQNSSNVFANTDIKGGVVISYRDAFSEFGAIEVFTPFIELNSIVKKVAPNNERNSLMTLVFVQNKFNLDMLYSEHPDYKKIIGSEGKDKRFRNNIFEKIPSFTETSNSSTDIPVIGVTKNKRIWRYLPERYIDKSHENLYSWKTLIVAASGTGAFGEVLSTPVVAKPREGYTQTFLGIGSFATEAEAKNLMKYIKTKLLRAMLNVLKITQHNPRETWRYIPLQDFTPASDIDWSVSIPKIDQQLYKKYGLTETEIAFIESKVKEMV